VSQLCEESYGDNLAIIESSLFKLTDYYFAPATYATENIAREILLTNKEDLNTPFWLICHEMVESGGSDITDGNNYPPHLPI
jgi:hypothetical protein